MQSSNLENLVFLKKLQKHRHCHGPEKVDEDLFLDARGICMVLCMCMLQKRTNILFDDQLWTLLTQRSRSDGISIGELVRRAVVKTYIENHDRLLQRKEAVSAIRAIRTIHKGIDYKKLINYGRKY